jgi:PAS domain S-box-containing protein
VNLPEEFQGGCFDPLPGYDEPLPPALRGTGAALGGVTIPGRERIAWAAKARGIVMMLALAAVYWLIGKAGMFFSIGFFKVSPVWPASGVALAALLMLGVSNWPGIFLGGFTLALSAGAPLLAALGSATGGTLESVLGVLLLRRWGFSPRLERVQDIVALSVGAALGCSLVGAAVATSSLALWGGLEWADFVKTLWVWWPGNAAGIIAVTPALLLFRPQRTAEFRWEALALGGCTLLVGLMFSHAELGGASSWYVTTFFFPLAVWAALRFSPRGVAFVILLFTLFAVWGAEAGLGLSSESLAEAEARVQMLLLLQLIIAVNATTALLLAAVSAGRRDATRRVELLATAVRGLSEGLVISEVTPEGPRVVFANEAFRAMVDLGPEALLGRSPLEHMGDMDPETRQRLEAALREASPFRGQVLLKHRGASRVHSEVQLSPVRDAGGEVTHLVSIHRDVSATQELSARLMAAERVAAVGTLAAGVGHEIQNPLAYLELSLHGATRSLSKGAAGAAQALSHLLDAQEGAERIRFIVADLRTFSREGADERERVDLREVVAPALRMVRHALRDRAKLVEEYDGIPQVLGSGARLGQVLLNLLVNAVQAIPPGQAERHTVRIHTLTAPDGRAQMEVSDTGRGIPPEVLPHIFKPFYTTKSQEEGTGLGLSICQQIIRAHGGEIHVRSEPGQGSVFTILLPPAPPEPPRAAEPVRRPAEPPSPPVRAAARRGRILIVDDEPRLAQSMRLLLAPNHDVVTTTRGSEALEWMAAGQRFDLVVCDLQMPGTTGMDIYARLREQAPEMARRLVFMSGGAFTPDASAFIRSVPNRVLEKPVRPEVLLATIDAALEPAPAGP